MRKVENANPEMVEAYNEALAEYQERVDEYNALSRWKRFWAKVPDMKPIAPGYYLVTFTHYLDGRVHIDAPTGRLWGDWCPYEENHVYVNDYSNEWYAERQRQQYLAERRAYEREQQEREYASSVWRANAGNAYYDNNNPWAYQRDPGRWG